MKQKPIPLTRLSLTAAGAVIGTTQAEQRLAQFCDDVRQGRPPDSEYLRMVAAALELALVDGGQTEAKGGDVLAKLGLRRRQGKRQTAEREARSLAWAVVAYDKLVPTLGEAGALSEAAKRHGIGERAMRDRVRKYRKEADDLHLIESEYQRLFGSEKRT